MLVTFLWSTSFILIKLGLQEIPPLTFAGLRYSLAFIILLPLMLTTARRQEFRNISPRDWKQLILLGILFYACTQGAQFWGLALLPAVTVSLLLNFTPVVVAVMGTYILNERPSQVQWFGAGLFLAGIGLYFFPWESSENLRLGLVVMGFGIIVNSASAILGRNVNRSQHISAVTVTVTSMGIGSLLLLVTGLITQGLPAISVKGLGYLGWLALVNTAFAFSLWNHTLRSITALESSIINGTMLIQITILAWIFLREPISMPAGIGMFIAALGTVLVQVRPRRSAG